MCDCCGLRMLDGRPGLCNLCFKGQHVGGVCGDPLDVKLGGDANEFG
jgi:hypothetical protein